jgi:hypothetical protein
MGGGRLLALGGAGLGCSAPPPRLLAAVPVGSGRVRDLPVVKMRISRDLSVKLVSVRIVFTVPLD